MLKLRVRTYLPGLKLRHWNPVRLVALVGAAHETKIVGVETWGLVAEVELNRVLSPAILPTEIEPA